MDDPSRSRSHKDQHCHFAGRLPAGTEHAVTVTKNGVRHIRRLPSGEERETFSVGLACSECFSGSNLARMLQPGMEYEMKVLQDMTAGKPAAPLSTHTSAGVSAAMSDFLTELQRHLPWKKKEQNDEHHLDWCVSLQLEGASAVWAGIDMLLQVRMLEENNKSQGSSSSSSSSRRTKVAVGATSYHGPPSTSFGSKQPLWEKHHQLKYPVPHPGIPYEEDDLFKKFQDFLQQHGHEIGVMLFEPQWGSSQAGFVWPVSLLKRYIAAARHAGILVLCDEIMCGLGRHGCGNALFLSAAWDLNPDAVTFGKALGAGVYPVSGAVVKRGRDVLRANRCSALQSHTYAGASVRALMTATAVLRELPNWFVSVSKLGEEMDHIFRYITKLSNGMLICHGQGLMWGGVFTRTGLNACATYRHRVVASFKKHCDQVGVLPYHVPNGGFMVTPVIDIDVGTIYEMGERFEAAVRKTMEEVGWNLYQQQQQSTTTTSTNMASGSSSLDDFAAKLATIAAPPKDSKCLPVLHATRSCTSCANFVCRDVRTRFLNV